MIKGFFEQAGLSCNGNEAEAEKSWWNPCWSKNISENGAAEDRNMMMMASQLMGRELKT